MMDAALRQFLAGLNYSFADEALLHRACVTQVWMSKTIMSIWNFWAIGFGSGDC